MKWALRLYPKSWRNRYGEEIAALIDESPNTWRTVPDLIAGAIKEQFNMQSFTRLALGLSLAGLVAGFAGSFAVTPQFTSHASFEMPAESLLQIQAGVESRASLAAIINDPRLNLYREEKRRIPLEDVEDLMRQNIRISRIQTGTNSVVSISFTYRDPNKAVDTVNTLITAMIREFTARSRFLADYNRPSGEIEQLRARLEVLEKRLAISSAPFVNPARTPGQFLVVIDAPNLPRNPDYPIRPKYAAAGFVAGLVAALLITLFRGRYRRPTLTPA
jgi:uncharacterized protein involved in exopolysaccharide biosynthesis